MSSRLIDLVFALAMRREYGQTLPQLRAFAKSYSKQMVKQQRAVARQLAGLPAPKFIEWLDLMVDGYAEDHNKREEEVRANQQRRLDEIRKRSRIEPAPTTLQSTSIVLYPKVEFNEPATESVTYRGELRHPPRGVGRGLSKLSLAGRRGTASPGGGGTGEGLHEWVDGSRSGSDSTSPGGGYHNIGWNPGGATQAGA